MRFLLLVAALLCGSFAQAQIFTFVDEMPTPGVNINEYLAENIQYPQDARDKGIVGKVTMKFVIDENGKLGDIRLVKSVCPSIDEEALRVLKAMPPWKPGKQNGKPVKVYYNLPIRFQLQGVETQDLTHYAGEWASFSVGCRIEQSEQNPAHTPAKSGYMLEEYLLPQLTYSDEAIREGISGDVKVSFCIDEKGYPDSFKLVKPLYPSLDDKAMASLKHMPRWEPALAEGKPVRSRVQLTITFIINSKSADFATKPAGIIDGPVLTYASEMPESGIDIQQYIVQKATYPDDAIAAGISGKVVLRFIVTKTGELDSMSVQRPLYPSLDTLALRLVSTMPKWRPGRHDGEPVNVWYHLPVHFSYKIVIDTSDAEALPDFVLPHYFASQLSIKGISKKVDATGDVVVEFVVNPDGTITDVSVKKSLHPEIDKEAVRLVSMMPRWKPARKKGMRVSERLSLPIHFNMKELRRQANN